MREPCEQCGLIHSKCTAHNHGTGKPCGMNPAAGSEVCRMHGGAAGQVKAKAAGRVREQIAASAAARFALPVEIDPGEALLQEVHRSAGMVAWLQAQVERVAGEKPDNLIHGIRSARRQVGRAAEGPIDVTTTEAGPGVHEWLQLWQQERKALREACRFALAAGIEQRMVEAVEREAERFGALVAGLVEDLGLTGAARDDAFAKAQARFTVLRGGVA